MLLQTIYKRKHLTNWVDCYDFDIFGTITFNKRKVHRRIKKALNDSQKIALAQNCLKTGFRGISSYNEVKRQIHYEAWHNFWHTLNEGYFGRNYKRHNLRIQTFNLIHMGNIKHSKHFGSEHTHLHFAALAPTKNTTSFIERTEQCWNDTDFSGRSEFSVVYNKKDLCGYMTHEFDRIGTDTIETSTTNTYENIKHYEEITNNYNRHFRSK